MCARARPLKSGRTCCCALGHSVSLTTWLRSGKTAWKSGHLFPVLEGRLYILSTKAVPVARPLEYYITLNKRLRYIPYCADFGPFNLGTTHHVGTILKNLLKNPTYRATKIVYYCTAEPTDITNAVYLMGAFLCLYMNTSAEIALQPFHDLPAGLLLPYRDATWAKSTWDLSVTHCWQGLLQAVGSGLWDLRTFDKNEYFYYDDPENGEFHEVMKGKFIAFKSPFDERVELVDGTFTLPPSDYIEVFKSKNVTDIVRLNSPEYDAEEFRLTGFKHHDLYFHDCSTPSDAIVHKFLRLSENAKGLVAVHCLAGLGRTGTLIALYMMKHKLFSASEAIAWLRICRPGSVIGPQQQYLERMQDRMHQCGSDGVEGLGLDADCLEDCDLPLTRTASEEGRERLSGVLSEQVTGGMMNRWRLRAAATVCEEPETNQISRSASGNDLYKLEQQNSRMTEKRPPRRLAEDAQVPKPAQNSKSFRLNRTQVLRLQRSQSSDSAPDKKFSRWKESFVVKLESARHKDAALESHQKSEVRLPTLSLDLAESSRQDLENSRADELVSPSSTSVSPATLRGKYFDVTSPAVGGGTPTQSKKLSPTPPPVPKIQESGRTASGERMSLSRRSRSVEQR